MADMFDASVTAACFQFLPPVFGQMAVTQDLFFTAPDDGGEEHKPHTYEILRISEVER